MCKYCYERNDNEISGKPIFQYELKKQLVIHRQKK